MALPIGKLSILIGAGIVGSVLAKEGRIPVVSDLFSGAFKIAFKQLKRDDSGSITSKPPNDSLLAQVNSLRQELQLLASNKSVTIVTGTGTGSSRYGFVVVVVVVGYGYIWWKGWKLPDLMFVTKRSLAEHSNTIAKQLEVVYSSLSAAKRRLSSKIDTVDNNLKECTEVTTFTKDEVSKLRGEMSVFGVDVQSVHHAVQTLETKISRIEEKQDLTNKGLIKLCDFAWNYENQRPTEVIQASPSFSNRVIQATPEASMPKAISMLPAAPSSPSQPTMSTNVSPKVHPSLQKTVSALGLKELHGISELAEALPISESPNPAPTEIGRAERVSSDAKVAKANVSSINNFFNRTRSVTLSFM